MVSNNLKNNNKVKEVCRGGTELEFWKRQHCLGDSKETYRPNV